jgi:predicted RNA-binding Zn-ribbon protein involved in translation (DUF1610 family)
MRYKAIIMSRPGVCTACRRRKDKVHRSRASGKLVCPACSDRQRLRVDTCTSCGMRKLLQARGRCFACYKREWRARRGHELAPSAESLLRTA